MCAARLRPLEERISLGLRARLAALGEEVGARVAIAGQHSAEFAATLRAVRAAGAIPAPIDVGRCDMTEIMQRFAEARVSLAILAGSEGPEEELAREAARRLGTPTASAFLLHSEGLACGSTTNDSRRDTSLAAQEGLPLLLFSTPPGSGSARAAEVPNSALSARIAGAIDLWGLNENDTVLSLGLRSDASSAIIDAVEAPLAAGASVALPAPKFTDAASVQREVFDLWAALRDEKDATIVFVASEWCWKLVDAYNGLARPLRSELAARWAEKPFRHMVSLANPGTVLSRDLAQRWVEIFGCPLTWHFSCAEVGSLFTVRPSTNAAGSAVGSCAMGLRWRIADDGELWAHAEGMFERYQGRPRSTEAVFDTEDGFCRTFHRVAPSSAGNDILLPEPTVECAEIDKIVENHLVRGPGSIPPPRFRMEADWEVKKVPIRVYEMWRTAWGGLDYTKKHNTANKVYMGKYK